MRQKNLSKSTKNVRDFTNVIRSMNACSNEQWSRNGKIIHKKSLRAPFTLIFHSEATYTSIDVFHFHFKCQRSNLSVLGMKTRPWKFVDLARKCAMITCTFRALDLKTKKPSSIAQSDRVFKNCKL